MEVMVPMMIQDPLLAGAKGTQRMTEGFVIAGEDFFLDGPVTRRVAVLDLDHVTGELHAGARFRPPGKGRKRGQYVVKDKDDVYGRDFNQVSVFATVLRTMSMFEQEDTLGRPLSWAFGRPQLLVVPRAGNWANAFYERQTGSLQLFFFEGPGQTIYTSLSRDIVAHETGHAILDGIAPDLYDALAPQSLALHEGVADMTALFLSFQSRELVETVLGQTGGSIRDSTAFNSIAEEFGRALSPHGRTSYLRSLLNDKTLDPADTSVDEYGRPNRVERAEPHDLSQVVSGALYAVMVKLHEQLTERFAQRGPRIPASGKALGIGSKRYRRMILRALDYLPPGEVSFADYGRAIIAADQASHPDDSQERDWLREEFARRHIVPNEAALEVETDFTHPAVKKLNLGTLVESDWAAYEFAGRNRKLLGIPPRIPFRVLPRLDCTKTFYERGGARTVRECLFKVSWDHSEPNPLGPSYPSLRAIAVGTTLAIDWETGRIRALLTSDQSEEQVEDRNRMLRRLVELGQLALDEDAIGPDGQPIRTAVRAEKMGSVMRVFGTARMLHVTGAAP
jgi:hypothetical protein